MLRRLPGLPAGGAVTVSNELLMLVYNRDSERMPSNITAILELWHEKLTSMHGSVANFIGTGKYHEKPPPAAPDLLSLDPEGLEYDVKKSTNKTAYKIWYTRQQDDIDIRVKIYSKIWSACSEEARAELKKDERFQEIHDAADDPLNLWELLVKHCSVVTKSGDVLGAQMAGEKAFGINIFINVPQGIQREKGYSEYSRMRCTQQNEACGTIHREARLEYVLAVKGLCTELCCPAQNYGVSSIRTSK
jgi:hypothetical protein